MDTHGEVRDFLTTQRERPTPDQAGIPFYGGRRRVKGLRREEVAMLAGMSTDYYTRLERGNLTGVSRRSSRRSPGPCSSTTLSGPTCSTSPPRPTHPAGRGPLRAPGARPHPRLAYAPN